MSIRYLVVVLAAALVLSCGEVSASSVKINRVRVLGNERLDESTVRFYARVPLTGEITQAQIDTVIKNLYATSIFSKVAVEVMDDLLTLQVKENPVVRNIRIKGNKLFTDKNLGDDVLKLKKVSLFTEARLQRDIANLRALYQSRGKLGVKITCAVEPVQGNSVDLVFNIEEGITARIAEVRFVGNSAFPDETLKEVLSSKERKLKKIFGFFGSSTKFFTERLSVDQSLLRDFYSSRGFLDFRVRSIITEVSLDLSRVTVVFSVEEGRKYRFGKSVLLVKDDVYGSEEARRDLKQFIKSTRGEVFNMAQVSESVTRMTSYLNEKGNLFASVKSEYEHDESATEKDVVNVTYVVSLGKSVYVNRISIVGNMRTLDPVIRHQLAVSEGDVYNSLAIRQSRRRLLGLGFFESVDVETYRVDDGLVDLSFKVEERGTGSLEFGAGFSSAGGLVGKINAKERNIYGTGKTVSFALSRSVTGLSSSIDLLTPYFMGSDVTLGLGVFYSKQSSKVPSGDSGGFGGLASNAAASSFSSRNAGVYTGVSCNLTDSVGFSLRYSYKHHSVYDVGTEASAYIKEQAGEDFDSSIGYTLAYSALDNAYAPRSGALVRVDQSVSGLGGTLHYVRTEIYGAYLIPLFKKLGNDITFKIKPAVGYAFAYNGEDLRIGQRFFVGSNEIRGFSASGIGPRDKLTGESLGGKFYYSITGQLDFPVGLPKNLGVRGSLFVDVASLSGLDYKIKDYNSSELARVSVGFGFSWKSPFGPVRVDFGFPIVKEKFDVTERMRISMDSGI